MKDRNKYIFADHNLVQVVRKPHKTGRGFVYECPVCGTNLPQMQGNNRFCKCCGNYLSWARVELERRRKIDPSLEDTTLWQFMQNPENGFYEDHELSMTTSHSEKQILEGCLSLMHELVDEFREYLEFIGVDVSDMDKDEQFNTQISYFEIVNRLFLFHTFHSGGTSTRMKMHQLGVDDEWGESFSFAEDNEYEVEDDEYEKE